MGNIIEVAKNRDKIMASQSVHCPICGEKQFSPFDKLYTSLNDKCVHCTNSEDVLKNSDNIFSLIEV